MNRLKASQIDHLSPGHRYTVIADFTDLNGTVHKEGGQWLFEGLEMDLEQKRVYLRFAGMAEIPVSQTQRMRPLFSDGEMPALKRAPRSFAPVKLPLPELTDAQAHYERAVVLARAHRFDEAEAMLKRANGMIGNEDPDSGRTLGEWLGGRARKLTHEEPLAAKWLYEQSIDAWYSWTSQATSGGEGTYRASYKKDTEREYKELVASLPAEYR